MEKYSEERQRNINAQAPPAEIFVSELQTNFVGTRQEFRFPGEFGAVSIFQGIPELLYRTLYQRSYEDAERAIEGYYNVVAQVAR